MFGQGTIFKHTVDRGLDYAGVHLGKFAPCNSDGFNGVTGASAFVLPTVADQSWSYRLVAGADLGSSNLIAVESPGVLAAGMGNIEISTGKLDTGTRTPPGEPRRPP